MIVTMGKAVVLLNLKHAYLEECIGVLVRSVRQLCLVLGDRLWSFRVRLNHRRCQLNGGRLRRDLVRRVQVRAAAEENKLLVGLADLSWVGLQRIAEHRLDFDCNVFSGGKRLQQIDSVRIPTALSIKRKTKYSSQKPIE